MALKTDIEIGSIGWKIRKIREYRGLSQKELGIRCGFSEATADVRIRQYESNKKVPREKALKVLCDALEIDESALYDVDLSMQNRYKHVLFELEDGTGIRPVLIDGHYYLDFGEYVRFGSLKDGYRENMDFLKDWYKKRAETFSHNRPVDPASEKAYDLWRYEYPLNVAADNSHRLAMLHRKQKLEEELQVLNEKLDQNTL